MKERNPKLNGCQLDALVKYLNEDIVKASFVS